MIKEQQINQNGQTNTAKKSFVHEIEVLVFH
jgi:hypothetical protein